MLMIFLINSKTIEKHHKNIKIFAETAVKEGICLSEKNFIIE